MKNPLAGVLAMTISLTAAAGAAPLNELDTALAKAGAAIARGEQDKLSAASWGKGGCLPQNARNDA